MSLDNGIALYAALLSTGVAIVQLLGWLRNRVDAKLTVLPRAHALTPDRDSHIEIDVQATKSPTTIRAIWLGIGVFGTGYSVQTLRKCAVMTGLRYSPKL